MKNLIAGIVLLLVTVYTCHSQWYAPKPAKGYYAIGDHYKKLPRPIVLTADSFQVGTATKGYYALKHNNRKLPKVSVQISTRAQRLNAAKGYYSIPAHQR